MTLADMLHNAQCDYTADRCSRYAEGQHHHAFYDDQAKRITEKLEHVVERENLDEVVRIVISEVC